MATLKIELLLDEPEFFRETRVGAWIHVLDYETGKGQWAYDPENKTCICKHELREHHRGARQCRYCPCRRFRPIPETGSAPVEEQGITGVCMKHPRPVYYDGECPACAAESQFIKLTDSQFIHKAV